MMRFLVAGAVIAALAFAGCGGTAAEETEHKQASEIQVCVEAALHHETFPECEHMPPGEKLAVESGTRQKLEQSATQETEAVLKRREAERAANEAEGG